MKRDILVEEKKYVTMKSRCGGRLREMKRSSAKKMFGSKICDTIFASRLRKTGKFLER